jgi:RNA polymerase sigma factor (TIGR02999 family)
LPTRPDTPPRPVGGRRESLDRLVPHLYDDLRAIAHRQLAQRPGEGTLSTTAVVHEAWLKLAAQPDLSWKDEGHFVALAAVAMRHVLVDRARARLASKRDGGKHRITLDEELLPAREQPEVLLQLSDAIEAVAAVEPRLAQVIDCRFFGGMSEQEVATALGVTTRSVQRDTAKARMLLRRALQD